MRRRRQGRHAVVLVAYLLLGTGLAGSAAMGAGRHYVGLTAISTANLPSPIKEYPIPPAGSLLANPGPLSIAAAPDGSFWLAENAAGAIAQFFPSNESFHHYPLPVSGGQPTYITVDSKGLVWFSDQANSGTIWMFDPDTRAFTSHVIPTEFSYPVGVVEDRAGNVWFAEDTGNKLGELVYPSYTLMQYPLPAPGSGPAELALAPGAVWVTESLGDRVAVFNTTSQAFREYTSAVPLVSPVGIVYDAAGVVWIAEHGGNSIVELNPRTGGFTYFPTSPPASSSGYANSAPATLVQDGSGRLWFVEHFSEKVGRLDPTTGVIDEFNIPSTGVYSVESALDSKGDFWFTEFSSNKVGMVPAGATVSQRVTASVPTSSAVAVAAGQTVHATFVVSNEGTSPVTLAVNSTSTFRVDGYTTSAEVSLNVTQVALAPGESSTVLANVSPDASLTPGEYSVGVLALNGNLSSVGILRLQVGVNPVYTLIQDLPNLLFYVIIFLLLGNVLVYREVVKAKGARSGSGKQSASLALVLGTAAYYLILSLGQTALAKCPGLPGIGAGSNGPSYVSIILTVVETSATVVLAFFLVRGYLTLRKIQRQNAQPTSGKN